MKEHPKSSEKKTGGAATQERPIPTKEKLDAQKERLKKNKDKLGGSLKRGESFKNDIDWMATPGITEYMILAVSSMPVALEMYRHAQSAGFMGLEAMALIPPAILAYALKKRQERNS